MTTQLHGADAIIFAETHGLSISRHADPIEGARDGLTADEAREIARVDPSLVFVLIERVCGRTARGFESGDAISATGGDVTVSWDSVDADGAHHVDVHHCTSIRPEA